MWEAGHQRSGDIENVGASHTIFLALRQPGHFDMPLEAGISGCWCHSELLIDESEIRGFGLFFFLFVCVFLFLFLFFDGFLKCKWKHHGTWVCRQYEKQKYVPTKVLISVVAMSCCCLSFCYRNVYLITNIYCGPLKVEWCALVLCLLDSLYLINHCIENFLF